MFVFFNLYTLSKETKHFIETKHFSATNHPYFKLQKLY